MGNEARQTINDLKTLLEHITGDLASHEKELEASRDALKKDQAKAKAGKATLTPSIIKEADTLEREFKKNAPELEKLKKEIAADTKDLTEAAGTYKREVDQKMDNYAAKFEKTVAKTLDLAPKAGADQAGLPTALQERVLAVAAKKAVAAAKDIEKFCKYALEKADKDKALAAPDLKAARLGLDTLKKVLTAQRAIRKKYAMQIKKAKNSKDLYKQFKDMDEAFAGAEKALVATMKQIAGKACGGVVSDLPIGHQLVPALLHQGAVLVCHLKPQGQHTTQGVAGRAFGLNPHHGADRVARENRLAKRPIPAKRGEGVETGRTLVFLSVDQG